MYRKIVMCMTKILKEHPQLSRKHHAFLQGRLQFSLHCDGTFSSTGRNQLFWFELIPNSGNTLFHGGVTKGMRVCVEPMRKGIQMRFRWQKFLWKSQRSFVPRWYNLIWWSWLQFFWRIYPLSYSLRSMPLNFLMGHNNHCRQKLLLI